jgi:single-stranded DNA-binding protein
MSWLNQISLCGVVKGDISIKSFDGSGGMIAEFTLTTKASFTKGKGSPKASVVEKDENHWIVVYSKEVITDEIQGVLKEGDWVTLSGRLQYRADNEGDSGAPYISIKRGNHFNRFNFAPAHAAEVTSERAAPSELAA